MTLLYPLRLSILLLLAVCHSFAQDPVTLEYKFVKGGQYRYRTEAVNSMTNSMNDKQASTTNSTLHVSVFSIDSILLDRSFVIVSWLDSMLINGSESPVAAGMLRKRTRQIVSPVGAVSGREALDPTDAFAKGATLSPGMFSTHRLPERPVAPNGTWTTVKYDTNTFFGTTMYSVTTNNYTLAGNEAKNGRDCLRITYSSKGTVIGKGNVQGQSVSATGKLSSDGTIYFDPNAGLIIAEAEENSSSMTMKIQGGSTFTIEQTGTKMVVVE